VYLFSHANVQEDTPSLLDANEFLEDYPEYIVVITHGTSLFLLSSTLLQLFGRRVSIKILNKAQQSPCAGLLTTRLIQQGSGHYNRLATV
jgi:hypothetical protein